MDNVNEIFRAKVREALKARGLSYSRLALLVGCSENYIAQFLSGKRECHGTPKYGAPNLRQRIAKVLEIED